ncbi:hypothetical protein L228DRAFT_249635 [Xylona heveae TC161]|uniref:Uncharacterized protein n=1 Tax=Xylona heveae (strain CBS 132557 / TC161) TaxID=1328760 RepID=A0A165FCG1_XYLHT|nr:hypothetical protein L228DRAFT_249635 [Xylona heveae TC161]KZF20820.1 hypothetical protein L228DRAFT_249635 [Xylona heveae TC161]
MMQTIVQQLAAMHVRDLTNAISVCSYPTYEAEPLNCSKDAINHLLPCPSDLLKRAPDIDRGKCCGQKISSSLSTSSGAPSFEQNTGGEPSIVIKSFILPADFIFRRLGQQQQQQYDDGECAISQLWEVIGCTDACTRNAESGRLLEHEDNTWVHAFLIKKV